MSKVKNLLLVKEAAKVCTASHANFMSVLQATELEGEEEETKTEMMKISADMFNKFNKLIGYEDK